MKRTFTVYADPGHAWAKVGLDVLARIGLTTEDFSAYSYRFGDYIYLEEDADLTFFMGEYARKTGMEPQFNTRHCNNRSVIRSYRSNVPGAGYYRRRDGRYAA